ncbi:MAG: AAA family ATPase [Anaerolineales bacterium]
MLSLRLLGPPQILRAEAPVQIPRRKSRALLYYLAANPDPQPRDHLLALLWPELDRPSAQQTLRTTLYGLRKILTDHLLINDTEISLAPTTEVDVRIFHTNLHSPISNYSITQLPLESLPQTLALYRGEFLEGFSLPDSTPYDDWQRTQAEFFRRLTIRGYLTLSQLHESQHNYRAALDALDHALTFDPLQEDLQRTALRLHYFAGDRAGAIRRYDTLRKLLDEEMGVPPMLETRKLYDAILTDTLSTPATPQLPLTQLLHYQSPITEHQSPSTNHPSPLPFTGRATELQTLRAQVSQHHLLLLEGEPGIGKTRLAEEFSRASGALVLSGSARELEQALPYHPLIEALRGLLHHPAWPSLRAGLNLPPVWLEETARLLPELIPPTSKPDLPHPGLPGLPSISPDSRLWEGVTRFLTALAQQHPLLLFIDDLQWADESTLVLLGYILRNTPPHPITLLATTRPVSPRTPLGILLQTLTRENRLTRLALDRLSPTDIQTLAETLTPANPTPLAEWLTHNSEGNPFIIAELIRHAREQHLLTANGLNAELLSSSPTVPQTVYSLLQSRLLRLSEEARRILDVAVVVGRKFDFDLVQRASGLSENAALDALDELRTAGLVAPVTGWQYEIDHLLTMEVAWREVGEARHRLLHRRVAETLEKMPYPPETVAGLLAFHYSEGYALPQAAPYAFQAGKQAARLAAWREAIGFYELALTGTPENQKFDLYIALSEAQELCGAINQAAENYRTALKLAGKDRSRANQARLGLGRVLITQGRFREVITLSQEVLKDGFPENEFYAEFQWGTALSLEGADLPGAKVHLKQAEILAQRAEDPSQLAPVTFELGNVAAQQGDLPSALAHYRQALNMAHEIENELAPLWQALTHNNLAYHLLLTGDRITARDHAQTGLSLAESRGIVTMLPYLYSTLGEIELAEGNLNPAEDYFKQGLELAQRLSNLERYAGLTANLGLVAREQGKTTLAIHRLSSALARADSLGTQHLAAQIRLWLAPLLPPDERRATLAEAKAIAEEGGRKGLLKQLSHLLNS